MNLETFDVDIIFNYSFIAACAFFLFQNAGFSQPSIFNILLNFLTKATMSFVVSGGILLSMQWISEAPIPGASGKVLSLDEDDIICNGNRSVSNLPTERFQYTFYADNIKCLVYFIFVLMLAIADLFGKNLYQGVFLHIQKRGIGDIIPLATTIMLKEDNQKERRHAIVQLMVKKVQHLQINIICFMAVEFVYFCIALFALIVSPIRFPLSEELVVRLNGSDWTVDCDHQITSHDIYTLVKCQSISSGIKIESYCIIPNNTTSFHLESAGWIFLLLLALTSAASVLHKLYGIYRCGIRRATDINLIWLLKRNVNYHRHKLIIDLFEMKLEEKARRMVEVERFECGKTEEKEKALEKDSDQGPVAKNEDVLIVVMDVAISNPD